MRIVLTGASGQLGSYLLEELIRGGTSRSSAWSRRRSGRAVRAEAPPGRPDRRGRGPRGTRRQPTPRCHPRRGHERGGRGAERSRRGAGRQRRRDRGGWPTGARDHGRRLVFTSTDLVFDGTRAWYREEDQPQPDPGLRPDQGRGRERRCIDTPGGTGRSPQPALRADAHRAGSPSSTGPSGGPRAGREQQSSSRTSSGRRSIYRTAARALVRLAESGRRGHRPCGGARAGQPVRADAPGGRGSGPRPGPRARRTGARTSCWPSPVRPTSRSTPPGSRRSFPTSIGRRSRRRSSRLESGPGAAERLGELAAAGPVGVEAAIGDDEDVVPLLLQRLVHRLVGPPPVAVLVDQVVGPDREEHLDRLASATRRSTRDSDRRRGCS